LEAPSAPEHDGHELDRLHLLFILLGERKIQHDGVSIAGEPHPRLSLSIAAHGLLDPACEDQNLSVTCVARTGVINGIYAGYRNFNGTNDYAFVLNHPNNLGYTGRAPYGIDTTVSATVWVR
jgi:hypothetical protein